MTGCRLQRSSVIGAKNIETLDIVSSPRLCIYNIQVVSSAQLQPRTISWSNGFVAPTAAREDTDKH